MASLEMDTSKNLLLSTPISILALQSLQCFPDIVLILGTLGKNWSTVFRASCFLFVSLFLCQMTDNSVIHIIGVR